MLQFDVISLFPEMFTGPFSASIVARAVASGLTAIELHQLRDFSTGRRSSVDDPPFGGGPGMVLTVQPLFAAVEHIGRLRAESGGQHIVLMSPQGYALTHAKAAELAAREQVTIVCGHYEGVDQRFIDHRVDEEISIGDYVLTGGELPAMVLVDAAVRLLPGALGDEQSAERDSLSAGAGGLLQGPVYTRPQTFRGWEVPEILMSGDHGRIEKWRHGQSAERTQKRRPDLLRGWPE